MDSKSRKQSKIDTRRDTGKQTQQKKQSANKPKPLPEMGAKPESKKEAKQETAVISDVKTAGKNGESNITVEWYWTQIGNAFPCGWVIGTADGNNLEVTAYQLSYEKSYSGTTSLKTGLVPVVPIGTTGKVDVTDTTTGEKREIKFIWRGDVGLLGMLWGLIKKLFTNSG